MPIPLPARRRIILVDNYVDESVEEGKELIQSFLPI